MTEHKTLEQKLNSAALEAHRIARQLSDTIEMTNCQAQEIKELKALLEEAIQFHPMKPETQSKILRILKP